MEPQLNLLADHAQPDDEQLGSVQRLIVRELRARGPLARDEIGALIHAHRGRHAADARCVFCGVDADGVIDALEHRGLVERARDGYVQIAKPPPPPAAPDHTDPFPEGF